MTNIKERILYISDYYKVNKEDFFQKLGFSYANFKGIQKKSGLNSDSIAIFLSNYPEVNPNWLLTGTGPMLLNGSAPENELKETSKISGIPILPFDTFAGEGDLFMTGVDFSSIRERYIVPLFDGIHIDFMIPVRGSSMYPKYNSGDVVACKLVKELMYVQWNKTYVIDTFSQGTIIKRLKKSENELNVVCKSDNKDYEEFELPKKDIRNIALVVGVIRLE